MDNENKMDKNEYQQRNQKTRIIMKIVKGIDKIEVKYIEKQKTEFLVNPICMPGCPQRKEHYRLNSLFSLTYGQRYSMKSFTWLDKKLVLEYKCKQ